MTAPGTTGIFGGMERSCSGSPQGQSPEPSRQGGPQGSLRVLLTKERPSLAEEEPEQGMQPTPTPASLSYFVVTLCTFILSHSGSVVKAK